MSALFNRKIIMNIFRTPLLRNIFLVILAIAILFPVYGVIFEIPQFTKMMIENEKNDTIIIAEHLMEMIFSDSFKTKRDFLPEDVIAEVNMVAKDFHLEKIILFSKSGKIIYSTDPKDIGRINRNKYFREIIAKGNIYSTLVEKEARSSEGRIVAADVIETYFPIMDNGAFHGALEIYYDITEKNKILHTLQFRSMLILFTLALIILIAVTLFLLNTSKINLVHLQQEEVLDWLASFPEHNPDPVIEIDPEGKVTYLNPKALTKFPDLPSSALQHPILEGVQSIIASLQNEHQESFTREIVFNDMFYEQKITCTPEKNLIRIFFRNITERKRTEEALGESEEKYRGILESIEDGYYEVDLSGNYTFFNNAFCRITGYHEDEIEGTNYRQFTNPETREKVYNIFNGVYTSGKSTKGFGWEIKRKDESSRFCEV